VRAEIKVFGGCPVTLGARSRVLLLLMVEEGKEVGEGAMTVPGSVANLLRRERPRSAALRYSDKGGVWARLELALVGC